MIPDAGLRVPKQESFLSRFRNNRLRFSQPASVTDQTSVEVEPSLETPAIINTDANRASVDGVTASTATMTLHPSEDSSSDLSSAHLIGRQTDNSNGLRYEKGTSNDVFGTKIRGSGSETNSAELELSQQSTASANISPRNKTAEQVADEAEDTLIEVVPETESLLSESRSSYQVLRFCAGSCLIDQNAVDHLVSDLLFK